MKKTVIKILVACLLISGIGVGGYFGYKKITGTKTNVSANSYMTVTAAKRNLEVDVQGTGSVTADVTKDIVANNSGEVQNLTVKVGDTVKKGDTIAVVNSDTLQQNVDSAETNLEKAQLQLDNAKTDSDKAMQQISVDQAQRDLDYAKQQVTKATLTSPIDGMVVAVNNNNGDDIQSGKAIVSIIDTSSLKVKVDVDELDIAKVNVGQKANLTFGAISGKTFEGTVESIAQTGTSSNNVTTYPVTVSITNPDGIKLGMTANVSIVAQSKENVLTIPAEALIEQNGKDYVRVDDGTSSSSESNSGNSNSGSSNSGSSTGQSRRSYGSNSQGYSQGNSNFSGNQSRSSGITNNKGKLVEIKTGLQNENYIEVTEGVTEGEKLLVELPKVSTTTNSNSQRSAFGSSMGGGFGGGSMGGGSFSGGSRSSGSTGGK
ncbi:efflux RND transporter periplasmic adaptor subunit [Clostridium sp. 19966]|uniref:efflux RND transporter periplasmic adaptor subunit n=1 Tax=Clostridium sp. 19966 TaxID=2768166 RepID=UPI0028DF462F|nr:efflux RND transporter periplasmic adaptor subunit [Clostridium sp. 19966]MDT8717448.1 efflux RND transporter periplasmic adaptor subunit [Clostridium sp. 19966]